MSNSRAFKKHPTADCIDFMRRTLEEDIDDLSIIRNVDQEVPRLRREYALATADSGESFPSMRAFHEENWGTWQNALAEQVRNASRGQITAYYAQKYEECPVCEESTR